MAVDPYQDLPSPVVFNLFTSKRLFIDTSWKVLVGIDQLIIKQPCQGIVFLCIPCRPPLEDWGADTHNVAETGGPHKASNMRHLAKNMAWAFTRTFQEVSINSLLEVKRLPKTTCWKVLVEGTDFEILNRGTPRNLVELHTHTHVDVSHPWCPVHECRPLRGSPPSWFWKIKKSPYFTWPGVTWNTNHGTPIPPQKVG